MNRLPELPSGERGQTSVEWLSIAAAIVAIGLALLTAGPSIAGAIGGALERIICKVGGGCSSAPPRVGVDSPQTTPPWESADPVQRATWGQYVSLGDSYASGEGLGPYQNGSDQSHNELNPCRQKVGPICVPWPQRVVTNGCHRSSQSYSGGVSRRYRFGKGTATWACSGSTTLDTYDSSDSKRCGKGHASGGQYGEGCQVERVNPDTSLVTLMIGGDDAGFAEDLRTCYMGVGTNACISQGPAIDQKIKDMQPRLVTDLQQIREHAPHARIIIVTYPRPFPANPTSGAGTCLVRDLLCLSPADQRFLNVKADQLNQAICAAAASAGVGAECVDGSNAFAGCEIGTANPCVNPPSPELSVTGGVGPAPRSFHPTAAGQRRLAELINNEIQNPPP